MTEKVNVPRWFWVVGAIALVWNGMGVKYVPLDDPDEFLAEGLDVIVFAVSILSFKNTVKSFAPHIEKYVQAISSGGDTMSSCRGPLVVDVLSVKGECMIRRPSNLLIYIHPHLLTSSRLVCG